ncbi:hypothetical protein ACFYZJ_27935 [Streptomyces sp. NPDC001848]|uniref:hypothetical protein n=1 Tax=Streptomyces sp. NPDC001848 TaxID=3364618 RepID=UPI0036A4B6D1
MRNLSETLSDLPDPSRVERGLLLPGDGGVRVELPLCRVLVPLGAVDPLGDDSGVGSGVEGCLVAGERPLAFLDRLAGLGLLGGVGLWGACGGARVGERFDGGGEPVRGEGPGDPPVQGLAHDVFPQVDGALARQVGVEGGFLLFELAAVVDAAADGGGLHLAPAQALPDPTAQSVGAPRRGHVGAVAEGDVIDVEEAFFLVLLVPDLVAGVAGLEEDGAHGALLPCGLLAVRIAGGVVGGGAGDARFRSTDAAVCGADPPGLKYRHTRSLLLRQSTWHVRWTAPC